MVFLYKIITDIMMGGDGTNINDDEMDEIHISAISEAMNQLMGAMSTSMATMFNRVVNISPPKSEIVQLSDYEIKEIISEDTNDIVSISFTLQIEGLVDSSIMQLLPIEFAKQIVSELLGPTKPVITKKIENAKPQNAASKNIDNSAYAAINSSPTQSNAESFAPRENKQDTNKNQGFDNSTNQRQTIGARPIQLTSFDYPEQGNENSATELGIDMILDVPLQVKVELGQCKKTIKEILELNIGSIISLDKLAGEPVDLVVNGKAIAKGEVIVIEDNYGIRITEILSPAYRIRK